MEVSGNGCQDTVKNLPLGIVQAFACLFHGLLRLLIDAQGRFHTLLCQYQLGPVTVAITDSAFHQAKLLQLRHRTGNSCFVFLASFANSCRCDPLGIPAHGQKALGVGTFQTELGHFHSLNFLNIVVHTGNRQGKQFIFTNHYGSLPTCCYINFCDYSTVSLSCQHSL